MYKTKLVSDIKLFYELENSWNSISRSNPHAHLFTSFAWIENWIHHYWIDYYLLSIIIISKSEKPVAVLPLYINPKNKVVSFLGTGEPEHQEVSSEYLDFVIDIDHGSLNLVYQFISEYLESSLVYPLKLINCLGSSHAMKVSQLCHHAATETTGQDFRIDLNQSTKEIFSNFSKNHRKKSKELLNRYSKSNTLNFCESIDEQYSRNWQTLKELHTESWRLRGKPGAFSDQLFDKFHSRMHDKHPDIPQKFCYLNDNDQTISINHYYCFGRYVYFYASGLKKTYGTLSPGILLHLLYIQSLATSNLVYDFMKGANKNSYKEKFCRSAETFNTITIFRKNLAGNVAYKYMLFRINLSKQIRKIKLMY